MPLLSLPVRSTFVSLEKNGLLISPGSCLDLNQLKTLTGVTDIIAPSLFHCGGIPKAHSVFPNSKVWGPIGASEVKSKINWTHELSTSQWPYNDQLALIEIKGMPKVNEIVFFHRETKSLIISDLCFNMVDASGLGAWIILNLFGTYRKLAVSKFFLKLVQDRNAFEQSLKILFSYDFENIIVSHGANVMGQGRSKLIKAFADRGYTPQ